MPTIYVTTDGTACTVAPCPATPMAKRRIADLWDRKAAISLASRDDVLRRMSANPVPKWSKT